VPFAETDDGRLYYETHGDGEPVLIHPGYGSTVELFFAITPVLAERYRVIVFDPRGSGRSTTEAPAGGSSMAAFANDAARVLDAAGEASAFVLGTSFGGMVVQHLALQYPERVRKLVLACTTPGGPHHVLPPPASMATFMAASGRTLDVSAALQRRLCEGARGRDRGPQPGECAPALYRGGPRCPAHGRAGA
jgi:pimeloyl-ACP methyl ester carboxylesterase